MSNLSCQSYLLSLPIVFVKAFYYLHLGCGSSLENEQLALIRQRGTSTQLKQVEPHHEVGLIVGFLSEVDLIVGHCPEVGLIVGRYPDYFVLLG